jgi:hypothetical protein
VLSPGLEYYLAATDTDGEIHTHPEGLPESSAFLVPVRSSSDLGGERRGSAPQVEIVAPEFGSGHELGDLILIASLHDEDSDLATSGVSLIVNGRDLSLEARINSELLVWIPPADLPPGPLRIEIKCVDLAGNRSVPVKIHLDLLGPGAELSTPGFFDRVPAPVGRIALDARLTGLEGKGSENRQEPPRTLRGRLNARGSLGWLDYRTKVFLTSDESPGSQARNRFRLDLEAGPLRVSAGDVTPRFNPLAIWGKRLRGVEVEMESTVLDAQLLYGSIQRSIEGEGYDSTSVDSPDEIHHIVERAGSYSRKLRGLRLGSVTGRSLGMSLSVLKIKDDIASIENGRNPKDNLVFGADVQAKALGRRLRLDAAVALSFLTNDISGGALSREDADSTLGIRLPFDPRDHEGFFIINASTTPLDMRGLANLAVETSARGNLAGNLFELRLRRIGPVYQSLAATSLPKDHMGLRLRNSFGLFQRRLRLTGEYETYHDNLARDKKHTKDSDVISGNLAYVPRSGALSGVRAGFRVYQQSNGVQDEVEGVDNSTLFLTLSGGAGFPVLEFDENLRLSLFLTDRSDRISEQGESQGRNVILESRTAFPNRPLSLSMLVGLSSNEYPGLENEDGGLGLSADFTTLQVGLDYQLEGKPLRVSWRRVSGEGDMSGALSTRSSFDLSFDYHFNAGFILASRLGWVSFDDRSSSDEDYNETFLGIGIEQPF